MLSCTFEEVLCSLVLIAFNCLLNSLMKTTIFLVCAVVYVWGSLCVNFSIYIGVFLYCLDNLHIVVFSAFSFNSSLYLL